MASPGNSRSGSGGISPWTLVIIAAAVILAIVLFFLWAPLQAPVPSPDSPVATGTVGAPAGTTGQTSDAQPGAPGAAPANPDLAPGTGTDITRGNN